MAYFQGQYKLVSARQVTQRAHDWVIHAPEIAGQARPGQFVQVGVEGFFLRRPISICNIDQEAGAIRLVFEVRGKGTGALAKTPQTAGVDLLGPLGNGFSIEPAQKRALLIGGGIGAPPMLGLAQHYGKNAEVLLGFQTASSIILQADFEKLCNAVYLSTDDGSAGHKGFVTDLLAQTAKNMQASVIYACGPAALLKKVAETAKILGLPCQLSLEERMACGVGACLGCACKIRTPEGESYAHVCKDGPVFDANAIVFE